LVAIGRSGNFRRLNVPGEDLDKVANRLHDPRDFAGAQALVVGGGDSALETAIALTVAGADVTLSHRGKDFSRAKAENVEQVRRLAANPAAFARVEAPASERTNPAVDDFMTEGGKPGRLTLLMESELKEIRPREVVVEAPSPGGERARVLPNDVVFAMIGREAPLDFFRRSGIRIANEWTPGRAAACAAFLLFCCLLYSWKSGGWLGDLFYRRRWFPTSLVSSAFAEGSLLRILSVSAASPAFWYTLVYSAIVVVFGFRRIRRRRTPYVRLQTFSLMAFQVFPLFLLPEVILPWLGAHHALPERLADSLFPLVAYGHGREYWRAYGFILAWPLMIYNVFTHQPLFGWLVISFVQTFVLIPALVYYFGKGAYCGWICSCGALSETLGDAQRQKMPHGPFWNRLNMAGQAILAVCLVLLGIRVAGWMLPDGAWPNRMFGLFENSYKWIVDVGLGGILGVGLYFWASGRVWCRFFCPLAALMHIYARFSRFRIFAEKKKCISCNVCTTVCHQGIDVMNFANKGLPMVDPQCVRCSACVQLCPTDVLHFGRAAKDGKPVLDALSARALTTDPRTMPRTS
jgi:ferredoxin